MLSNQQTSVVYNTTKSRVRAPVLPPGDQILLLISAAFNQIQPPLSSLAQLFLNHNMYCWYNFYFWL